MQFTRQLAFAARRVSRGGLSRTRTRPHAVMSPPTPHDTAASTVIAPTAATTASPMSRLMYAIHDEDSAAVRTQLTACKPTVEQLKEIAKVTDAKNKLSIDRLCLGLLWRTSALIGFHLFAEIQGIDYPWVALPAVWYVYRTHGNITQAQSTDQIAELVTTELACRAVDRA